LISYGLRSKTDPGVPILYIGRKYGSKRCLQPLPDVLYSLFMEIRPQKRTRTDLMDPTKRQDKEDERRQKISDSLKRTWADPAKRRDMDKGSRRKISDSKEDPGYRQRPPTGSKRTGHYTRRSQLLRDRWADPVWRKRQLRLIAQAHARTHRRRVADRIRERCHLRAEWEATREERRRLRSERISESLRWRHHDRTRRLTKRQPIVGKRGHLSPEVRERIRRSVTKNWVKRKESLDACFTL
jgi:hypothetical protein